MKKSTRILFQTQEEKDFVKLVIEQNILCSGNELVELYQKVNECEFYNNLENQLTPIVTDKQEYFDYVKEYHSESLDDLKTAMREWYENDGCEEAGPYDFYYGDYIEHLKNTEQEYQEVLQWFIVTDWLAAKLSAIGEPILSTDNHKVWGRTCYGQAIELDGTIQEIFRGLE